MKKILDRVECRPRFAVWELTLACNMKCGHCGSRAGKPRPGELTLTHALDVCHQLIDAGLERLTLSGGEPTMHPQWQVLARELTASGVTVNMITNGWEWSDEKTQLAVEAGLANVCFSIDGLEATHDAIRRRGSFARCIAGLESCRRANLPTASIITVNRKNRDELGALHDLLVEKGVTVWQPQVSDLMGNQRDNIDWALLPQDLPELEDAIADLKKSSPMKITVGDNVGFYGPHEELLREDTQFGFWVGCFAGCQVVGIEANGNIKGCLSQQDPSFVEGSLQSQTFQQIWNRKGAFAYNRDFSIDQLEGFCRDCRYAEICRAGCACTAHFASGSKFDNPYCTYRVLQLRAQGVVENVGGQPPQTDTTKNASKLPGTPAAH